MNSIKYCPPHRTKWSFEAYVPQHEALSYTWDEDENKDKLPMILNGKPFYITPNLHSALLAIRRGDNPMPFWIDTICIDQNDNAEKEQQLRIMHQIYKHATNVRIWLGNDDQSVDIRAGLALMSHCLTKFEQVRGRRNSKLESDWDILFSTSWSTIKWRALFGELEEIITGKTIDFSRKTVEAEYLEEGEKKPIVPKIDWHTGPEYSSVFVGDYDITDILRFVELLYATSECRIEPEVTSRIHHLVRSIVEYRGALNLGKLLATFRGKGSTIPADQVYSLLGLTVEGDTGKKKIGIDYKQSTQKLCTDTTKYILAKDNNLDVLRMVNTHAKPINEKWPLWVPDFTSPLPGLGEPKSSYWKLPPADLSRTRLPAEKMNILLENGKLIIHGHVLSEIRKPLGIVENNGQRDKELEYEKRPIGERQHPRFDPEFLPMSVWEDSEGREVRGTVDVKKGDLVVMVARSESPLILRRLMGAQRGREGIECEWPEYTIVGDGEYTGTRYVHI
ncbi:hypothetical protein EAE96_008184 [Botrytis aclada]|nr:hypothetical protein EAE96_008184 [Botrytis aclada]